MALQYKSRGDSRSGQTQAQATRAQIEFPEWSAEKLN